MVMYVLQYEAHVHYYSSQMFDTTIQNNYYSKTLTTKIKNVMKNKKFAACMCRVTVSMTTAVNKPTCRSIERCS